MNPGFINILKQLISEQGKEAFLNYAKCKAFLADYARGEYKKESRLLLQALEAGVQKEIDAAGELDICKKQQIRVLREERFLTEEAAAEIVDALALVLREAENKTAQNTVCANCGKELQKEWKTCPYCSAPAAEANGQLKQKAGGKQKQVKTAKEKTPAEEAVKRGETFLRNKDYDIAIKEFTEAIRLDSNNSYAHSGRGIAYFRGQWDAVFKDIDIAFEDFNTAIMLDPNNDDAYCGRGDVYLIKGKLEKAYDDFSAAQRLNAKNADAYYGKGNIFFRRNQWVDAFYDYEHLISYRSKELKWKEIGVVYCACGYALLMCNRFDDAIEKFHYAIQYNPNNAGAYSGRGQAYSKKGKWYEAIKDFEVALSLEPNNEQFKQQMEREKQGKGK
jgi:tetratricopeptide (TPR) repeat protein